MRLKISRVSAQEALTQLLNSGYALLGQIEADYATRRAASTWQQETHMPGYKASIDAWLQATGRALIDIFPTQLELNSFANPPRVLVTVRTGFNMEYEGVHNAFRNYITEAQRIAHGGLDNYTDLPIQTRLYVSDIDSFHKVRDVHPDMVKPYLDKGFLERSEAQVQSALEQILSVPFERKDWAGEINDLYTSNVIVNGARRATAFLLKGPGIGKREMSIADCGKRGDQVMRLFSTPADLYVLQYVGPIADLLVKHVEEKVELARGGRKEIHFMIMDGQDTARVMLAYGKL